MRIANNVAALNTHRQYSTNNASVAVATEKLSSGYRINRAGDDAAGLAISEKMRAQIRGLSMASKNSQDAISLIQTAEGALTETHAILQRMRELSVQSATDTNDGDEGVAGKVDRKALNAEFEQLKLELDDIANTTKFNGKNLLNGEFTVNNTAAVSGTTLISGATAIGFTANAKITFSFSGSNLTAKVGGEDATLVDVNVTAGTITISGPASNNGTLTLTGTFASGDINETFASKLSASVVNGQKAVIQTGADTNENLTFGIDSMTATALKITSTAVNTREAANTAIDTVNSAINQVSEQRANLGALQNRLQHKIKNLDTSAENLQAAEGRIRDLDMAKEMTNFTKNNILVQASTAMLAQANAAPQGVLQLMQ